MIATRPLPADNSYEMLVLRYNQWNAVYEEYGIGVDLAKHVYGATRSGDIVYSKKLRREQFRAFLARLHKSLFGFDACGSASYWLREAQALGHAIKVIQLSMSIFSVRRQKSDAADDEAIVIAARQTETRFLSPKSGEFTMLRASVGMDRD